ncbi:MAG TPA: bifunctional phosphoribosylaminoimidazolecarboxamide formyltransferase/IMP cyclohydrolase [Thermoplasmata archaeon]|nr:bifunctional phosphoribosylaminoimidazolecarboxamide formyltransferase/IMP cyclohydrolase [Thermoplasmata archaeon]
MTRPDPGDPIVRRALLSVSDTRGLAELAHCLTDLGVELVATSGTRAHLAAEGVPSRAAEELTGIGAWFGGRIKTLHPGLLGGVLAPRTPEGLEELASRGLLPIDLVVSNLYPFAEHLADPPGGSPKEEFVDIGGVTLIRAAAKNWRFVGVLSSPSDYPEAIEELRQRSGRLSEETRHRLARLVFDRTAAYDRTIADALGGRTIGPGGFPEQLSLRRDHVALRYGENPHQPAATYRLENPEGSLHGPGETRVLKGGALSYTNLVDLDTALSTVAEFSVPSAAVVKHATPCGVATGAGVPEALSKAFATDPVARYGCAVAVNRPFQEADAEALHGVFVDLLAAPEITPGALDRLGRRPKIKVVAAGPPRSAPPRWEVRSALGRILVQHADERALVPDDFGLVTTHRAPAEALASLDFAWRVVRHAKSNAIVLAQGGSTVGIGSGQATRVKAVELAVEVAGARAKGSVLASDAFFPFPDGIEAAGKAGISAILQPGGSIRDPDVIAAAERHGIAMYFTRWRVFRH